MLIGILAGLATGALWGLTFIAPLAVEPLSAWDLTVVRYEIFGLTSLLLMISPRFRAGPMTRVQAGIGLALGAFGYTAYVAGIFFAVKLAGVAIPPLVIGTTPILLALIANRQSDRVPWRALALPLGLITAGMLTVNLATLASAATGGRGAVALGALCAFASLSVWITYAIINQSIMQGRNAPDALRWTGLQGIGAALGSLLLLPLTSFHSLDDTQALIHDAAFPRFMLWCLVMGLGGSWLATWCWVVASRRLPLALAAQLIVGETLFGLIYGFIYEQRWPNPPEAIGSLLQLGGVMAGVAIFHARQATPIPATSPLAKAEGSSWNPGC